MHTLTQSLTGAGPRLGAARSTFWHDHADVLITRPIRVVVIIVVALLIRLVAHRAINRMTRAAADGSFPRALRPLRGTQAVSTLLEISPLQSERRRQRSETLGSVLRSAVSAAVFVIALLMILPEFGVNLAPLLAGTSIVGLAIGFGAQNLVKDFLGGMFIILEDQYGVGDMVDVGEASGTVEAVGLRTTQLRDARGTLWYVRNGEIIRVGNKSQGYAEILLDVPITPDADAGAASDALRAIGAEMAAESTWSAAFLEPPDVLGIEELTQTATVIRMAARTRPADQFSVARELRRRIRDQLGAQVAPAATVVHNKPPRAD